MKNLAEKIIAQLGFKTNRKLILICSDDWGGVRIKSVNHREQLKVKGINVGNNRFDQFDTLESNHDMEGLFEVLTKYKDCNGNHPVFTVVMNVANPDFEKIKAFGFSSYFFEPFTKTLARYPDHNRVYSLYQQGLAQGIFKPQFHGREHLQTPAWLKALQRKDLKTSIGFEYEFFFLQKNDVDIQMSGEFADAYDFWSDDELEYQKEIILSGVNLFKDLFNYNPIFFTAPVSVYHKNLNEILHKAGIQLVDVPKLRREPKGLGRYRRRFHYMGQQAGQTVTYVNRNAVFESNLPGNGVEKCLTDISRAFSLKKPAIISNHRASFVGGISEDNRANGLMQLDLLLSSILKKWPDVEFIDMEELNQIIHKSR